VTVGHFNTEADWDNWEGIKLHNNTAIDWKLIKTALPEIYIMYAHSCKDKNQS
jgi:hypothetical protein